MSLWIDPIEGIHDRCKDCRLGVLVKGRRRCREIAGIGGMQDEGKADASVIANG
jgi:hypothetical protein